MRNYFVTHEVVVSTTAPSFTEGPPTEPVRTIRLKLHSIVRAESPEDAQTQVVQHRYPGFVSQIENIMELGDSVTANELFPLMNYKNAIQEEKI